ncbi:MAG: type III pantothenate kinase [Saprospiraceae bacterium]|nr:type III pantothenate kinase [Saprospiraceae bacterium]MBP7679687.1 type III pantothenate kinase [Saprospiraceae bacterium]
MNFIIDVGNTRTKFALFSSHNLVMQQAHSVNVFAAAKAFAERQPIRHAILSASGNVPPELYVWLTTQFKTIVLTHKTPIPIVNKYATPETLGKDRLAGVVGAFLEFGTSCLVIDTGTSITYNLINGQGEFLGGNITPGIQMRLQSMHHFTAKLPLVSVDGDLPMVGYDTATALRTGACRGVVLEMDGFISSYQQEFVPLTAIVTGGNTEYFVNHLKNPIFADPNIVLKGLNKILQYNVQTIF